MIVHLSDLHFGRVDARVVNALHDAVWALAPHVVAVSGDLTQRARRAQFRAARAFMIRRPAKRLTTLAFYDGTSALLGVC